jgi:hypothetical protein
MKLRYGEIDATLAVTKFERALLLRREIGSSGELSWLISSKRH